MTMIEIDRQDKDVVKIYLQTFRLPIRVFVDEPSEVVVIRLPYGHLETYQARDLSCAFPVALWIQDHFYQVVDLCPAGYKKRLGNGEPTIQHTPDNPLLNHLAPLAKTLSFS